MGRGIRDFCPMLVPHNPWGLLGKSVFSLSLSPPHSEKLLILVIFWYKQPSMGNNFPSRPGIYSPFITVNRMVNKLEKPVSSVNLTITVAQLRELCISVF
jgi:hypothetical protein